MKGYAFVTTPGVRFVQHRNEQPQQPACAMPEQKPSYPLLGCKHCGSTQLQITSRGTMDHVKCGCGWDSQVPSVWGWGAQLARPR